MEHSHWQWIFHKRDAPPPSIDNSKNDPCISTELPVVITTGEKYKDAVKKEGANSFRALDMGFREWAKLPRFRR